MSMADFIIKIVKTSQNQPNYGRDKITNRQSLTFTGVTGQNTVVHRSISRSDYVAQVWADSSTQSAGCDMDEMGGIRKDVSMANASGPSCSIPEVENEEGLADVDAKN
jgi:hypothetical protein